MIANETTCAHYNNYHIALLSVYLTASKEKEHQLQAELDTIRKMDQQISMLEQELQAKQEKVRDQFEQRETEILEQTGEQNNPLLLVCNHHFFVVVLPHQCRGWVSVQWCNTK